MNKLWLLLVLAIPFDGGWLKNVDDLSSKWEPVRLPQQVKLDPQLAELEPQVQKALKFWNSVVGREVLKYAGFKEGEIEPDTIYVEFRDLGNPTTVVGTYNNTGLIVSATVFMPLLKQCSAITRQTAIVHEFGHVLGLAHDDDTHSVMREHLSCQMKDYDEVRLQESDQKALKDAYQVLTLEAVLGLPQALLQGP